MGQSSDAILFYGMCWDEEGVPLDPSIEDALEDDWELDTSDVDDIEEVYRKRTNWPKNKDLPFELVIHCHSEVPMVGLAIPDTVITSYRGHKEQVNLGKPPENAEQILGDVCKVLNIKPANLGWWMVSYLSL